MIKSNHLTDRADELIAQFPTRVFLTAEEAMARSSREVSGTSRVFVLPCGAFTWTDADGFWTHPEYGSHHTLDWLDAPESDDDDEPVPVEVAERVTSDDPFSHNNFGPWELSGGDEVEITLVSAKPRDFRY